MENMSMSLVDAALNELGMLSSVTDSRKDYLSEQAAARRRSSSYNVLQLNPTYVTCLGPVSRPERASSNKHTNVEEAPRSLRASSSVPQLVTTENRVCRRQRSKPRYSRPYHIPKQYVAVTRSRRTTEPSEEKESMVQLGGGTDTSVSVNLDLTSDNDVVPTVHCLTRSKSVDDVRRGAFQGPSNIQGTSQHQELEMVSSHLRDLQVSSQ
ncbi:uncharacterized protein LOC117300950 [Asterias rubens]|uniref:uncharacterized protein LOC117300950 n=1 Tax=Asterias rubens TaxID=7604 RepID=UPI0014559DB9|nr:uncharacterized protein LOC117300950 [Asterias rubens]